MKYLLTIFEDEKNYDDGTGAAMRAIVQKHMALGQELGSKMIYGAGLAPTMTATTVRMGAGQHTLHDGPYAETKEQMGGLYVVEADDLDEAIALAKKIPFHGDGAIEVRPLMTPPGM